jgi:hypothetical protein
VHDGSPIINDSLRMLDQVGGELLLDHNPLEGSVVELSCGASFAEGVPSF